MPMLIQNARVIDPSQGLDEVMDLLLEDGKIAQLGSNLPAQNAQVVDGTGLVAAPGLVDMHVHLRDPGLTHKEDVYSGCRAAAAGGVTSLLAMPNTKPAMDSPETVRALLERAQTADAAVYTAACVTKDLQGEELADLAALKEAGAIALSDDGRPVVNTRRLLEALEQAPSLGLTVTAHCEDLYLASGGLMHEGEVSRKLGVPGIPAAAEDCGTAREIAAAASIGAPIHICHVSTKGSVALIRDAKARGVQVTAETCPHYLLLTDKGPGVPRRRLPHEPAPAGGGGQAGPHRRFEGWHSGRHRHGPCPPHAPGEGGLPQGTQRLHRHGDVFGRHPHRLGRRADLAANPGEDEHSPRPHPGHPRGDLAGGRQRRRGPL